MCKKKIPIPSRSFGTIRRKGRRDGKIPIPNPFRRKGRRDGNVLVGKSDFLLFFCLSDVGGITLFFCELLYVIPPSSERQTGCYSFLFGYSFNRLKTLRTLRKSLRSLRLKKRRLPRFTALRSQ